MQHIINVDYWCCWIDVHSSLRFRLRMSLPSLHFRAFSSLKLSNVNVISAFQDENHHETMSNKNLTLLNKVNRINDKVYNSEPWFIHNWQTLHWKENTLKMVISIDRIIQMAPNFRTPEHCMCWSKKILNWTKDNPHMTYSKLLERTQGPMWSSSGLN